MKQVLAIFRKDARHFWPEILVSVALWAALCMTSDGQWQGGMYGFALSHSPSWAIGGDTNTLPQLLMLLIPLSWWILIARAVHEERLVGHTQFWLTRPYEWRRLLAAKVLFLAAFVYAPLVAAQCILMRMAGFHPLQHWGGLAFELLLWMVALLPLLALGALTANFARMTLAILGVLLVVVAVVMVNGRIPRLGSAPDVISDVLILGLLVLGTAAAVVWQYWRRRARTGWLVLGGAGLLIWAVSVADVDQAVMNHHYDGRGSGERVVYAAAAMTQPMAHGFRQSGPLEISVPIAVKDLPPGTLWKPSALRATLDGAGGEHWASKWQTLSWQYQESEPVTVVRFSIAHADYERFRKGAARLRLVFAVDEARVARVTTVPLSVQQFEVPGYGVCQAAPPFEGALAPGIGCRSAMRMPDLTTVEAELYDGGCRDAQAATTVHGLAWTGGLDSAPAAPSLTSVWNVPVGFRNIRNTSYYANSGQEAPRLRTLCPGSPVRFTTYAFAGRTKLELVVPEFQMPDVTDATTYSYRTND